jgi:hypothetical protein
MESKFPESDVNTLSMRFLKMARVGVGLMGMKSAPAFNKYWCFPFVI